MMWFNSSNSHFESQIQQFFLKFIFNLLKKVKPFKEDSKLKSTGIKNKNHGPDLFITRLELDVKKTKIKKNLELTQLIHNPSKLINLRVLPSS